MFSNDLYSKRLLIVIISVFSLSYTNCVKGQTFVTAPITGTPAPGAYYNNSQLQLGTSTQNFSVTATSTNSWSFYVSTDCSPLATIPSANQNYVTTTTPRQPFTSLPSNPGSCDLMQTIQYFDALGRPLQTVQVQGSPLNKDMVQPFAYDALGREAVKYLPYAYQGTANGSYKPDALFPSTTSTTSQQGFYQSPQTPSGVSSISNPQLVTVFEPSPLNRVIEQGATGDAWQPLNSQISASGHTVKVGYDANSASAVLLWTVTSTGATGGNTYYGADQLYKKTTTDENGSNTIEYKDKQERVVCKKFETNLSPATYITSYYIYDDYDNLRYVIPPLPAGTALPTSFSETDAIFSNFVYGYHYDERNRLIQKKIPGKGWEYMVYNKLDQQVLTQDAVQRVNNQWTVTKYDVLGRVITTGLWSAGSTIAQNTLEQSVYAGNQYDVRDYSNATTGYNITSYPTPLTQTLTINYYDDYNNVPNLPPAFVISGNSTNTKGLLTAAKTEVLNSANGDLLSSVNYYDDLGRNTQSFQQHYLGGVLSPYNYDVTTFGYNFSNQTIASNRMHYKGSSSAALAATIGTSYNYDHMGRKTQTFEQINGGINTLLSQLVYNEVGQLYQKKLHSEDYGNSFIETITNNYNERGWLKEANSPNFDEKLYYNTATGMVASPVENFNGNITEAWYTSPSVANKGFYYTYDPLNRLLTSSYYNGNTHAGQLDETAAYDNLGNITSMTRSNYGNTSFVYSGSLVYNYSGNQVTSITNSGSIYRNYSYDNNGNAITQGTFGFDYNFLNLPIDVRLNGTIFNTYTYTATGQKIRKVSTASTFTTDYINGIQYKNNAIDFIETDEGRYELTGTRAYQYELKDHLGNVRTVIQKNTLTTATALQENEYYAFGLNVNRYDNSTQNKYLYNKKELQDENNLNQYDYGARFYDPVIARWASVDPLAEQDRRTTPYSYTFDDPIRHTDPDGMFGEDANGEEGGEQCCGTPGQFQLAPLLEPFIVAGLTAVGLYGLHAIITNASNSGSRLAMQRDATSVAPQPAVVEARGKNKTLPDIGVPNSSQTNPPGTSTRIYGPDGVVVKEHNKGHPDHPPGTVNRNDHVHDHTPRPNRHPKDKQLTDRQPAREPTPNELQDDLKNNPPAPAPTATPAPAPTPTVTPPTTTGN